MVSNILAFLRLDSWPGSVQVQCNVFEGASGEVSLTAGGGLRQLPGLSDTFENAALVCSFILSVQLIFSLIFSFSCQLFIKW